MIRTIRPIQTTVRADRERTIANPLRIMNHPIRILTGRIKKIGLDAGIVLITANINIEVTYNTARTIHANIPAETVIAVEVVPDGAV